MPSLQRFNVPPEGRVIHSEDLLSVDLSGPDTGARYPCGSCYSRKRWRLAHLSLWVCGACHPPTYAELAVWEYQTARVDPARP